MSYLASLPDPRCLLRSQVHEAPLDYVRQCKIPSHTQACRAASQKSVQLTIGKPDKPLHATQTYLWTALEDSLVHRAPAYARDHADQQVLLRCGHLSCTDAEQLARCPVCDCPCKQGVDYSLARTMPLYGWGPPLHAAASITRPRGIVLIKVADQLARRPDVTQTWQPGHHERVAHGKLGLVVSRMRFWQFAVILPHPPPSS